MVTSAAPSEPIVSIIEGIRSEKPAQECSNLTKKGEGVDQKCAGGIPGQVYKRRRSHKLRSIGTSCVLPTGRTLAQ
jgi:hypothetical protein